MRKLLQFKLYSFLSSKWGMTFCVVGLFVTLNAFFQIVQLLLNPPTGVATHLEYTDNIAGVSYKHIMCTEPIDVVYTWVNGSDPLHIKAVNDLKRRMRDPAMLSCNATQSPDKDYCFQDEDTQSRFIDNEELRYSLRSLIAFAPWVHHIYLVTNGQIPYWLNLDHPRLSVITHEDIFTNKSHLPTFSSPSIETHIHRIPGLSSKFIYLNDDVMFGREVYPDDFYTHNSGQKVFLSWPVPNCAEGCPSNWIGDGYCDLACNVSACDFDAHDCDNYTGPASGGSGSRWWNTGGNTNYQQNDMSSRYKNYCAKGCPDTWIGDKYCDRMCKNVECGFDAGDCGVEDIFSSMHGVDITWDTTRIELPPGIPSVYFNLSAIVHQDTITDGSHDNADLVRTATISQKHKIMTLTFHRNISLQEVMLSISAEHGEGTNKTAVEKTFNITIDTTIIPTNETEGEQAVGVAGESNAQANTSSAAQQAATVPVANPTEQPPGAAAVDTNQEPPTIATPKPQHPAAEVGTDGDKPAEQLEVPNTSDGNQPAVAVDTAAADKPVVTALDSDKQGVERPAADQPAADRPAADQPAAAVDTDEQGVAAVSRAENALNMDQPLTEPTVDLNAAAGVLTEERPEQAQGAGIQSHGGGLEEEPKADSDPSQDSKPVNAKESTDPMAPLEIEQETAGAVGSRSLLSIPIDDKAQREDLIQRLQWEEVAARKKEQKELMEAEMAADQEKERLIRLNKEYEALLLSEAAQENDETQGVKVWPWERQKQIDDVREMHGGGRRLLDMYGDSLKHVNKLYNHAFGPSSRKVPAHMPHMIDKHIMEELQVRWPEEWESTSSHSLRSPQDMQYAFAYFYYLIHAKVEFNFTEIWEKELDVDMDGKLNDIELRTLGVHLYGAPLKNATFWELKERLLNVCQTHQRTELAYSPEDNDEETKVAPCPITINIVEADNKTAEEVRKTFSKRLKYKHQLDGTDEVAFLMVGNNDTVMQGKLDGVRQKRHRFICLNDNINHSSPDSGRVVNVLHDFYMSVLPLSSPFELPPNTRNAYAYIGEVREARAAAAHRRQYTIIVGVMSLLVLLFAVYKCYRCMSQADRRARERRATRFLNT